MHAVSVGLSSFGPPPVPLAPSHHVMLARHSCEIPFRIVAQTGHYRPRQQHTHTLSLQESLNHSFVASVVRHGGDAAVGWGEGQATVEAPAYREEEWKAAGEAEGLEVVQVAGNVGWENDRSRRPC